MENKLLNKYFELLKQRHVGVSIATDFEIGFLYKNKVVGNFNYDIPNKFMNRIGIIFPVKDLYNKIVSVYFRKLDNGKIKYDSLSFEKQYLLFGLHYTWQNIVDTKSCVLVEGPFDFFVLLSYGINNVCCSLGTSLSLYQMSLLRRFANMCYIVYDGDSMGTFHSKQVSNELNEIGLKNKSILLPNNLDPDQFIIKYGKQEFLNLLQ